MALGTPLSVPISDVQRVSAAKPWRDHMILSMITLWTAMGLAVDARRHGLSAKIDTFFTGEHGIMYASVTAYAVFLLWMCRQHMERTGQRRLSLKAIPDGWGVAIGAVALAACAGLSDLAWHTAWGIEQNLNILFSPAHLMIMVALTSMPFAVVRAAWVDRDEIHGAIGSADDGRVMSLKRFWPIAVAVGAIISVVPVFLGFTTVIGAFTTPLPPGLATQAPDAVQFLTISSVAGLLLHTLAWFGPLLLIVRRWRVPVGSFTIAIGVLTISQYIQTDFALPIRVFGLLAGAVVCDLMLFGLRQLSDRRFAFRLFAVIGPPAFWGSYILVCLLEKGAANPFTREALFGSLLWSAALGAVMASIMLPPRAQPATYLD